MFKKLSGLFQVFDDETSNKQEIHRNATPPPKPDYDRKAEYVSEPYKPQTEAPIKTPASDQNLSSIKIDKNSVFIYYERKYSIVEFAESFANRNIKEAIELVQLLASAGKIKMVDGSPKVLTVDELVKIQCHSKLTENMLLKIKKAGPRYAVVSDSYRINQDVTSAIKPLINQYTISRLHAVLDRGWIIIYLDRLPPEFCSNISVKVDGDAASKPPAAEKASEDGKGYGFDGFNRDGFDNNGYDRGGYDKYGYNSRGFDREGYDKRGYNQQREHKTQKAGIKSGAAAVNDLQSYIKRFGTTSQTTPKNSINSDSNTMYDFEYLNSLSREAWAKAAKRGAEYMLEMNVHDFYSFSGGLCAMIGLLTGAGNKLLLIQNWIDDVIIKCLNMYPVRCIGNILNTRDMDDLSAALYDRIIDECIKRNIYPLEDKNVFKKKFIVLQSLRQIYNSPEVRD